jgi:molecular chaperone GrpE
MATKQKDWQKVIDQTKTQEPKADPEPKGIEHPEYQELQAKLTEAENKVSDLMNEALRARAELENTRRRTEQDIAKAHKFGLEKFALNLLPVIDSLEHGIASCDESNDNPVLKNIRNGMELTLKIFLDTLQKQNIYQIDPLGKDFNPELHAAMSIKEDANIKPNTVVQVLQKGYTINDRLLRPALVIVAKTP